MIPIHAQWARTRNTGSISRRGKLKAIFLFYPEVWCLVFRSSGYVVQCVRFRSCFFECKDHLSQTYVSV